METPTFLYKPNFCAECGEKIDRENWHFWSSRRFCDNCEPVYRMNRILPAALTVLVVFFGGIFFGQMGQIRRGTAETPPVIATQNGQAAFLAEKLPQTLPKQPAGLEPPQNSAPDQPPAQLLANSAPETPRTNPAPGNSSHQVRESPAAVYTCGARTQKGTPCSRRVKSPGARCWQHFGKTSMLEKGY